MASYGTNGRVPGKSSFKPIVKIEAAIMIKFLLNYVDPNWQHEYSSLSSSCIYRLLNYLISPKKSLKDLFLLLLL